MSLLGIDIGTSDTKVILLDGQGKIVGNVTEEYPVSTPRPQWSEQDPEDWWQGACRAIRAAMEQGGVQPADIEGVGLSGQMVELVLLDDSGLPLRPYILWNDQRAGTVTEALTEKIGLKKILSETGNPLFAILSHPSTIDLPPTGLYHALHHVGRRF